MADYLTHSVNFHKETVVPEGRYHHIGRLSGWCELGQLRLQSGWEEPVSIDCDHDNWNLNAFQCCADAPSTTADVVRIHRLGKPDVGVRIKSVTSASRHRLSKTRWCRRVPA